MDLACSATLAAEAVAAVELTRGQRSLLSRVGCAPKEHAAVAQCVADCAALPTRQANPQMNGAVAQTHTETGWLVPAAVLTRGLRGLRGLVWSGLVCGVGIGVGVGVGVGVGGG